MQASHIAEREGFARADEITAISELGAAWQVEGHGPKLRAVRKAAEGLRERVVRGPRVVSVRSLPVTTVGYPTKFAFWGAQLSPAPWVIMTHRALLVQFLSRGELKTLLFNPTDDVAARKTPFFERTIRQVGDYIAFTLLAKRFDSLEHQLAGLGVSPESVDYVAFDHFHSQDLRGLLGTRDGAHAARFPNAKLLAQRAEWDDWDDLHPLQRAWFVAEGKAGVRTDRVALLDGDFELGDGALLLRTPGHTRGHQTLLVNTPDGIWGVGENGVSADNWSPHESRIAGLARTARMQDLDVILNANTPEQGALQYTSMVLEKALVDRVNRAPGFVQMFPSSEVTPSPLAPGLSPSIVHGGLVYGEVTHAEAKRAARSNGSAFAAPA